VIAVRANGGRGGGNGGDVDRHLPDRGYVAHVATPGPQATTPVNAARVNVGTRGRELRGRDPVASTCRIAAKRLRHTAKHIGGDRVAEAMGMSGA